MAGRPGRSGGRSGPVLYLPVHEASAPGRSLWTICSHDMADGWLFKLVSEGLESRTRPMTNWWASWLSDENKALACVKDHVGDCRAAESKTLSEQQLKLLGLRRPGDVKKVRTEF